ncbi:hypothetical protein Sinac_1659 [Singulisphaera acidiphila DSM 18658]|uniref:Uncharacterized protein n=1 Tax=Singulisphaera acidiphila (strain ATCC BAA-1392 / DSM 18658 / VKM B-2454 / MOB10) TaxID=886293 RepID=L0D9W7_SINAD|nr:hypothetical protein Sinac_1659 [Singulisphaera acidiphila DSM 18658]
MVFIGHSDPKLPEIEQPPLAGFMRNYRMGVYGDGKPVILADLYIKREFQDLVSEFPRRSVEIFRKTTPHGFIDSLALLKRAPERDLGLVTYSKTDEIERVECDCHDQHCCNPRNSIAVGLQDLATQKRGGNMALRNVENYIRSRASRTGTSPKTTVTPTTRYAGLSSRLANIAAEQKATQAATRAEQARIASLNSRLDRVDTMLKESRDRAAQQARKPVLEELAERYSVPDDQIERYSRIGSDTAFQDAIDDAKEQYATRPTPAGRPFSDPLAELGEPLDTREIDRYIKTNKIEVQSLEDATRAVEGYIAARKVGKIRK